MRAAVVVTGDEVLHGRVAERNAAHLCAWLEARGVEPDRITVLPDDRAAIAAEIRARVASGVGLVITSGGLGVTHDDVTVAAVADAAGVATEVREDALALVRARADATPNRMSVSAATRETSDRKQATLPVGARLLPPVGTAPGCALQVGGTLVIVLPGPPFELERMWERAVADDPGLSALIARAGGDGGRRVLRIHGVVESQVVQALDRLGPDALHGVRMGICARVGEIEITLADAGAPGPAGRVAAGLRDAFGDAVFSEDGRRLEEVVAGLLSARGEMLAVAESCTGGMLGQRLTALAGSSAWFAGGVIAYANTAKRDLLGVSETTLATDGAVSAASAVQMADGARRALRADWALSVTGIAGPGGATPGKPVGLVFIGCAGPGRTVAEEHRFRGERDLVRQRATAHALHMLRRRLRGDATG